MLLKFVGLKPKTFSGYMTIDETMPAEYRFVPKEIYELSDRHGEIFLSRCPGEFIKVDEKSVAGGIGKGFSAGSGTPDDPPPTPADPPRGVKEKEAKPKKEKSKVWKTSFRRKERKKLSNAVDFLSWLYEHCEGGNINFRFLGGKFPRNEFIPLSSLSESPSLVEAVLRDYHSLNSYFAIGTRDKTDGSKEGILQVPALWVDLDGSPLEKVAEGQWSPSAVVETSPNKYHVYWKLREPADRSKIPLVEDLLRRLASFFKADPAATDASRILRIPGTSNFKTNPPHPVQVVIKGQEEWNLWDFDDLPEVEGPTASQPTGGAERMNDRLKKILECRFLQHCDTDRATLSEPEWFAMIGILARETGGPVLIHQLSRGYPKYSSRETDAKILHAMNGPPMTCSRIKHLWNCEQDCGVKSPAALAFKRPADSSQPPSVNDFPRHAIGGLAGEFADLFSHYLESPWSFFAFNFLTCLGHLIADRVTMASEITPQPRLYTVILGESADDRKSESIKRTIRFFEGALIQGGMRLCHGVGSSEGLAKILEESQGDRKRLLLIYDELKAFVGKACIEGSTLLPAVSTLFESNRFHTATKKEIIRLEDVYLSLLGASTVETYSAMWTPAFLDIGFLNRLWLVKDHGDRKYSIPREIPWEEIKPLHRRLGNILSGIPSGEEAFRLPISPEALEIFDAWYLNQEPSIFAR